MDNVKAFVDSGSWINWFNNQKCSLTNVVMEKVSKL